MIKLTPKQFTTLFNSSCSIIRIVEQIIEIDKKLESGSWYAIKASGNLITERNNLVQRFDNLRKAFNNAILPELESELQQIEEKLGNYKVNSFVKAIGRQFLMVEKKELKETIELKKHIQVLRELQEIISSISEDNL